jgi:two-component system chemotaxis response regulator CheY
MKKILIVDDSYYMRAQLKKIVLTDPDFSVIGEAANGLDAINFLKNNQPDIITLDMTMPVMDGIDFFKKISPIKNNYKVIVISALSHENRLLQATKLGACDFIRKPYDIKNILNILQKYK